jgi:hypothetical protein
VHRQKSPENIRLTRESSQDALAQCGPPIQCKQETPHQARSPRQPTVRGVIGLKIILLQSFRKRSCLMEAQTKSIASDGIYASGRISNEGHPAVTNSLQGVHRRDRSAIYGRWLRPFQS